MFNYVLVVIKLVERTWFMHTPFIYLIFLFSHTRDEIRNRYFDLNANTRPNM